MARRRKKEKEERKEEKEKGKREKKKKGREERKNKEKGVKKKRNFQKSGKGMGEYEGRRKKEKARKRKGVEKEREREELGEEGKKEKKKELEEKQEKKEAREKIQKRAREKVQKKTEVVSVPKLIRFEENPIISPNPENYWECWQTFNPAVIMLDGRVHFIYRAIGVDNISRLGYASSDDGIHIRERLSYPVYEHPIRGVIAYPSGYVSGGGWGGAEDPRIVRVDGEDVLYMTYTAWDENGIGVALTSIKVQDFLARRWNWKKPMRISKSGEIHKNWVIFPEKIKGKYAVLHSISPEVQIFYRDTLEFVEGEYIESHYDRAFFPVDNLRAFWLRGVGSPPLKTRIGWLTFYHRVDIHEPNRYKVGVMILELDDPSKVLFRSDEPILEPETEYENTGFKPGIVYVTGAIIKDGNLFVYYGAADNYVAVAYAELEVFLKSIEKKIQPKLTLGSKVKLLK